MKEIDWDCELHTFFREEYVDVYTCLLYTSLGNIGNDKNKRINMAFNNVYRGKKVLITGNTGFKGSWLSAWLLMLLSLIHICPGPSRARKMVRQDWGEWTLDAYYPMIYNKFYYDALGIRGKDANAAAVPLAHGRSKN